MAGLGTLIRLILRRDRIKLPLWIGGFVLSLLSMIPLLRDIYGDKASLSALHTTFGANPAGLFMTGPMDEPTFGALMMIETLLWWGIAIAFFNTLLIVRHTRHNEEIGAQELLLSGWVHRASGLAAALIVALGANILIALGLGFGMQAIGGEWSANQVWLYAVAMSGFGLVWAAIAAVVVQLVEGGRSANGLLAGLIGGSFIVRGIGDFLGKMNAQGIHEPAWLSSLSSFGWMQATRPLTQPDWTPLLIAAGFVVSASVLGFALLVRRDVGAGLLPGRKGKVRASRLLATPLGLTLYLQKNIFIGWLIAVLVTVGTIGVLVPQMSDVFNSADSMRQTIEAIGGTGALVPTFMSVMMAIVSLIVFAYVVHGLSRLCGEESSGHLESLLATRLSRLKWLGLHVSTVLFGGLIMLAAAGCTLALLTNTLSDYSVNVWEYSLASLSYAPVAFGFAALYAVLFALVPRAANGITWLYVSFVAFALWLGPIVKLDQMIMDLSVMEHMATPPVEKVAVTPLITVTAIGALLMAGGLLAWRQRNLIDK